MTSAHLAILAIILAAFLAADLLWRRIPLWLFACAALGAGAMAWSGQAPWSWVGLALGVSLAILAGMPGGDVKAAALLGAVAGPVLITVALMVAFMLTLLAWRWGLTGVPWMFYVVAGMIPAIVGKIVAAQ